MQGDMEDGAISSQLTLAKVTILRTRKLKGRSGWHQVLHPQQSVPADTACMPAFKMTYKLSQPKTKQYNTIQRTYFFLKAKLIIIYLPPSHRTYSNLTHES